MEGEKDFQIDSMYEMDAPMFREFNETDYSVNESIFERKTVGEKPNFEDSTLFRSPGGVFRDISNTTSTMSNNSRISLKSNLAYMTPPQKSPALAKRRITRSVTKALQTAKDHDNTLIEEGCDEEHMENLTLSKSTSESGKKKPVDQVDSITSTTSAITSTDSVAAVAELPIEEPPVKLHNSTSRSSLSKNSTESNLSSSKKSTPAVKLGRVSAHSGTPFKGKKSPLKTLRARTRSHDSAANTRSKVHQRTASSSSLQSCSTQRSLASGSTKTSSLSGKKALSGSLSRLMKCTESARLKRQGLSPSSKRKGAVGTTDVKPPKIPKNTIPQSPSFLRRPRTRVTPIKSSEQLELEKVEREKQEMQSLKKINDAVLRNSSGGSIKRSARNATPTNTGSQVKAKRSIYDVMKNSADGSKKSLNKPGAPRRDVYARITKPISPKFQTAKRERPATVLSEAERVELELKQMKQQQFKAAPLDRKVLEGTATGTKIREPAKVTQPLPVQFATDQRVTRHASRLQAEESPKKAIIKAQPAPKPKAVFKPVLQHKSTAADPFTFESKEEQRLRRRAELLQRVEEEERKLREFKANPLPPSPAPLPQRKVQPVTQVEPFQLRIDERGEQQQQRFQQQLRKEEKQMLEATIVKAKPANILNKQPFVIKKEAPKYTEPLNIQLSSTKRAEERKQYALEKEETDRKMAAIEAEMKKREELRALKELRQLRKETVIKPEPIKHYKPLEIKRSERPLTLAKSPRFAKR